MITASGAVPEAEESCQKSNRWSCFHSSGYTSKKRSSSVWKSCAGDGQVDPDKLFPFHMHVHSLPAMPSDGPSLRA